jgi:hypothetical protein
MEDNERFIDIPDRELSIIASLNKYSVRYLIVGGYAMLFHGYEDRAVNDLDIWIDRQELNAHKCFDSLNAVMPDSLNFQPIFLSVKGSRINLRDSRYDVDIFISMDGAEFDVAFSRCGKYTQNGELLYFVGTRDLLAIKREAHKSSRERMEKEGKDIVYLERLMHEKQNKSDSLKRAADFLL